MSKRIIFRVDGDSKTGLGHIYRCLALAELLEDKFQCIFVTKEIPESLSLKIRNSYKYYKISSGKDFDLYESLLKSNDIVVLDGYNFDTSYQLRIRSFKVKIVVIDDFVASKYFADVVINHGLDKPSDYYGAVQAFCKVYTGFKHVIVRKVFLDYARESKNINEIETLFICMGGADPFQLTQKTLQAAARLNLFKRIIVVTGPAFKHISTLTDFIENIQKETVISHYHNISGDHIAELMNESQVAICPSSTISLEACCIRVGLLTGYGIDNQRAIHDQLIEKQCAMSVGDFNSITVTDLEIAIKNISSVKVVQCLITNQVEVFDGLSAVKNLELFDELAG